jgi:hypothetical protein
MIAIASTLVSLLSHPDGMAAMPEIPQSFSTVHSFAQGQRCRRKTIS